MNCELEIAQQWIDCLNRGDLDGILDLYDGDVTFHPTLVGTFIRNKEGAKRYFMDFLRKNPQASLTERCVKRFCDSAFLFTGNMNIDLEENGVSSSLMARFTFVWQKPRGAWRIVHHHNSLRPA